MKVIHVGTEFVCQNCVIGRCAHLHICILLHHQQYKHRIPHVSYCDHMTNEEILQKSGSHQLQDIVAKWRPHFVGHIIWLPQKCHMRVTIKWIPPRGRRKRGRTMKTWHSMFRQDPEEMGISWYEVKIMAINWDWWRTLADQYVTMHRRN